MPVDAHALTRCLHQEFPDAAKIDVKDFVGDNNHYSVTVVDNSFKGLSILQQHQMVYKALESFLQNQLHAIDLKTSHSL